MNQWIYSILLLLIVSFAPLCYSQSCDSPAQLRLAVPSTLYDPADLAVTEAMVNHIAAQLKIPVTLLHFDSDEQLALAMINEQLDIAYLGTLAYLHIHHANPAIQAFAMPAGNRLSNTAIGYYSLLISRAGSTLTDIASTKNSVLALVGPGSTSGYLVPKRLFKQQYGIELDQHFSTLIYSGRHQSSVHAVLEGKVDAAFIASTMLEQEINIDAVQRQDFNIIWRSPSITPGPFAMRASLCKPLREAIIHSFLNLHHNAVASHWLGLLNSKRLTPASDSDYQVMRQTLGLTP